MDRFTNRRFFMVLIYGLLCLAVLYMLLKIEPMISSVYRFLRAVLTPFLIAMIISYVLNPVVNMLNVRKVPRTAAVLLIYAVFITSVVVIMMNLIPMFMKQLNELNEHMPQFNMKAQSLLDGWNSNRMLPDSVRTGVNKALNKMEGALTESITQFVNRIGTKLNMVFVAFIVPFLAFYILKDVHRIERTLLAIVPKKHRRHTVRLLIDIDRALGNYVRGQILVCAMIGGLAYFGYWAIGMPYPLLLASVVAIFNIIPYLGPFFGAAPAIIMASTISIKMMLFVIAVNWICQLLEGNVISPQVVGKKLHLHPLIIIFALLVGGQLAGIIGLIIAVPMFAVGKVVLQHVHLYYKRHKHT